MRRVTDKRSPVQPHRNSPIPLALGVAALALVAWTLRDTWVDPLDVPAPITPESAESPDTEGVRAASRDSRASSETLPRSARGRLASLFSADDYPADAAARDEQGTVGVELAIDEAGRVAMCTVSESSGFPSLDQATCRIIRARARFQPALDAIGQPVPDQYRQRITWRLEG